MVIRFINADAFAQHVRSVPALIFHIVDGENSPDVPVGIDGLGENHSQRRLPVVGVNDIRHKSCDLRTLDHSAAEEREPFTFIIEPVDFAAFEIVFVIHEVIDHAVLLKFEDPHVLAAPGNWDVLMSEERHFLPPLRFHCVIQRHNDPTFDFGILHVIDRSGKGACNFSKPAGPAERHDLRRSEKHFLFFNTVPVHDDSSLFLSVLVCSC